MEYNTIFKQRTESSFEEVLHQYELLANEAEDVRNKDRVIIKGLFGSFYDKQLNVGIGFQRAYGAILSGDYFELFKIPGDTYLFVFADISGHGLPAYTTLVRLRSAITLSVTDYNKNYPKRGQISNENLVKDISTKFTDIMDAAQSNDFASIVFTFIRNENDKFILQFFNRGMYFPFVVRKFQNNPIAFYDLNKSELGWFPQKGHLLGREIRKILGDRYERYPTCEFVIYEGDSILFFSDGITEAHKKNNPNDEFGTDKIKNILINNYDLYPQAVVNIIFDEVYEFIGDPKLQLDDMTAVMINFPPVRNR